MEDREHILEAWQRVEFTLAWLELESLLTAEVRVTKRWSGGNGLWTAQLVPAQREVNRRLNGIALNAMKVAADGDRTYTSRHVRKAKGMIVNGLQAYARPDPWLS